MLNEVPNTLILFYLKDPHLVLVLTIVYYIFLTTQSCWILWLVYMPRQIAGKCLINYSLPYCDIWCNIYVLRSYIDGGSALCVVDDVSL